MIAWALFIPACFALNCAPGPNNMLVFSNAARLGLWPAMAGGMGRMPAFVILIAITIIGLGAILATSALAFTVVKLAGAAYLIYVGIRFLRHAKALATSQSGDVTLHALMRRDFLIAIGQSQGDCHLHRLFSAIPGPCDYRSASAFGNGRGLPAS